MIIIKTIDSFVFHVEYMLYCILGRYKLSLIFNALYFLYKIFRKSVFLLMIVGEDKHFVSIRVNMSDIYIFIDIQDKFI